MNTLEIRKTNGKIYSFIRQKDLVCTPEEEVRQNFICKLVNDFGYPIELMADKYFYLQNDFCETGYFMDYFGTRFEVLCLEEKLKISNFAYLLDRLNQ